MPESDSDDEPGPGRHQLRERTPEEEEYDNDMGELADYKGDSDDDAENADGVLTDINATVRESLFPTRGRVRPTLFSILLFSTSST